MERDISAWGWVQTLPLVPKSSLQVVAVLYFWNKKLFWKVTSAPSLQPPPHHHHLHKFSISLVHFLFLRIQSDICLNYCFVKLFHKRCLFGNSVFFPRPLIVLHEYLLAAILAGIEKVSRKRFHSLRLISNQKIHSWIILLKKTTKTTFLKLHQKLQSNTFDTFAQPVSKQYSYTSIRFDTGILQSQHQINIVGKITF